MATWDYSDMRDKWGNDYDAYADSKEESDDRPEMADKDASEARSEENIE